MYKLDTVAVHMALLPTEKIIVFSGDDDYIWKWWKGKSSIWDPNNKCVNHDPKLTRNLFCSGHCMLPDGRLLVAGGQSTVHHGLTAFLSFLGILQIFTKGADHDINIFNPQSHKWNQNKHEICKEGHESEKHKHGSGEDKEDSKGEPVAKMPKARWYPTCITLPDGKALIASGIYSQGHYAFLKRFGRYSFINENYEIFDPETNQLSEPKHFLKGIRAYPFLQILPNEMMFVHYLNTTKLWKIKEKEFLPIEFKTELNGTRTYDGMGSCVMLPIRHNDTEYKIMVVGGSTSLYPKEDTPATNQSEIFEFNPEKPEESKWRKTKNPTNSERFLSDSVLLPDGTILVTNGAGKGTSDHNEDAVMTVEIFNPETEVWTKLKNKIQRARLYHGTAVLLADGRVVVAGSTGHDWPPSNNEKYIEFIKPPYLQDSKDRPEIIECPEEIEYDKKFEMKVKNNEKIKDISLIRISSTTHNNNMDQRCLFLEITNANNDRIEIKNAENGSWAPPGYYLIHALNDQNIPSEGKMIRIKVKS
ncbi:aldehyde oxidase family protein [Nitrosopumilus sp. b2]|uniref:aldehyde oxidase family protein n=1 Tax=Nitrosopumilus sp. b2 TaxID=2109908 RepID=UPI0015F5C257|nr:aldehyde oxidase family protein [Nitrosopumilus sp. b2]KAF6245116.1 hypothetical protein C6989_05365 [Nitrosopumilus sp. b2]